MTSNALSVPDSQKVSRLIPGTLPPGEMQNISGVAETFYLVSSTGQLSIKTNIGIEEKYSAFQGKDAYRGNIFQSLEVTNRTGSSIDFVIFYGFGQFIDNTKIFTVAGAVTTTPTDPNFAIPDAIDSSGQVTATGVAQQLLAHDNTRGEAWLWTDEASNLAYWAESAARLASPLPYQQIGANLEGLTKIRSKSAIYVVAAAGVKIGAIVFKN